MSEPGVWGADAPDGLGAKVIAAAMHLITVLRGRGYTVQIEGDNWAYVTIRAYEDDDGWSAQAPSTEQAIFLAARALVTDVSETLAALQPLTALPVYLPTEAPAQ